MKNNIRGEKIVVTKSIRNYIESKIEKLEKYFENPDITAHILIKVKGHEQKIEVTIPTTNFTIRAEESSNDLYAAVDLVTEKIERQIRKNKTKLNKISKTKEFSFEQEEIEQDDNKIVKRKKLETKPMSEEEAILQMNMLGHDFFIFKDVETNNIYVLYKRKDGNYGLIETN